MSGDDMHGAAGIVAAVSGDERAQYWLRRLMAETGLPPHHVRCTFETFEQDDGNATAYRLLREYAAQYRPGTGIGVMLYGPPGVGKSHLCAATIIELWKRGVREGFRVRKWALPDLLAITRSAFADVEDQRVRELWAEIRSCAVIWLDDLIVDGLASLYEARRAGEMLYRIVNTAVEWRCGLLVTTNCEPATLRRQLAELDGSDRIFDRLREAVYAVEIRGASRRLAVRDASMPEWFKRALGGRT